MASFAYNEALRLIKDSSDANHINLKNDTLKIMLVTSAYTPNRTHDFVDEGGDSDPIDAEISVAGYIGGWNGTGRKILQNCVLTVDDINNYIVFSTDDLTWTFLGAGATVTGAIVIKEGVSNDTTSRLIIYIDVDDKDTDWKGFPLKFNANGLIRWNNSGL